MTEKDLRDILARDRRWRDAETRKDSLTRQQKLGRNEDLPPTRNSQAAHDRMELIDELVRLRAELHARRLTDSTCPKGSSLLYFSPLLYEGEMGLIRPIQAKMGVL